MLLSSSFWISLATLCAFYSQDSWAEDISSKEQAKRNLESCLDNLKIAPPGKCNYDERMHLETQFGMGDMIRWEKMTLEQRKKVAELTCLPPSMCTALKCDCRDQTNQTCTKAQTKDATCDKEFDTLQQKIKDEREVEQSTTTPNQTTLVTTVTPQGQVQGQGNPTPFAIVEDEYDMKINETAQKLYACLENVHIRYNDPCSLEKSDEAFQVFASAPFNLTTILAWERSKCLVPSTCVGGKCDCPVSIFTELCKEKKTQNVGARCETEHAAYFKAILARPRPILTLEPEPTTTPIPRNDTNDTGVVDLTGIKVTSNSMTLSYCHYLGIFLILLAFGVKF